MAGKMSMFSKNVGVAVMMWCDPLLRILLILLFITSEYLQPVIRVIQPEEMWRHRFPDLESQIPIEQLFTVIMLASVVIVLVFGARERYRNFREISQFIKVITLSIPLTGIITNVVKAFVGRPRPNYLMRCYGAEYLTMKETSQNCFISESWNGDLRKSFPSGHSSLAFSSFGVLSLYIAGKLGSFSRSGRGGVWRFMLPFIPILFATWVAVSRYSDYHHHSEDILVGSLLGLVMSYISYRQYYPGLSDINSNRPYSWLARVTDGKNQDPKILFFNSNSMTSSSHHLVPPEQLDDSNQLLEEHRQQSSQANSLLPIFSNDGIVMNIYVSKRASSFVPSSAHRHRVSLNFYWDDNTPISSDTGLQELRDELLSALINQPIHDSSSQINVRTLTK